MKRDDVHFMTLAISLAREAGRQDEVPVGAVVVLDGSVVGRGRNRMIEDNDPTAHAEVVAIRDAAQRLGHWRLDGATLYVTLEPCPMCAGAILAARIGRVVYGADDPRRGAVVSIYSLLSDRRLGGPIDVIRGVMKEDVTSLLREFFEQKRTLNPKP